MVFDWIGSLVNQNSSCSVLFSIDGDGAMKRDMDLIRDILLRIEAKEDLVPEEITLEGRDPTIVGEHIELLFDAGFIKGTKTTMDEGEPAIVDIVNLSWEGHEFLGSIGDPDIWEKTKSIAGKAGKWTLVSLWKTGEALLLAQIKEKTGLDIS